MFIMSENEDTISNTSAGTVSCLHETFRSTRDALPAHYSFQIKNFSLLLDAKLEKYESGFFTADKYKWRLILYPNGNKEKGGEGYISLYVEIINPANAGWEVKAYLKFLVYDQIRDKFLVIEDASRGLRRFHKMMTRSGFHKLLSVEEFNDPSKGFLLNDCCLFGAEVFVVESCGNWGSLSMIKEPRNGTKIWDLKYSSLTELARDSDPFTVEGRKWKLRTYLNRKGCDGACLALHLKLDSSDALPAGWGLYVEYTLQIKDQIKNEYYERSAQSWYCEKGEGWGFCEFVSLRDLKDESKGYLVNDSIVLQGKITLTSVVENFS